MYGSPQRPEFVHHKRVRHDPPSLQSSRDRARREGGGGVRTENQPNMDHRMLATRTHASTTTVDSRVPENKKKLPSINRSTTKNRSSFKKLKKRRKLLYSSARWEHRSHEGHPQSTNKRPPRRTANMSVSGGDCKHVEAEGLQRVIEQGGEDDAKSQLDEEHSISVFIPPHAQRVGTVKCLVPDQNGKGVVTQKGC